MATLELWSSAFRWQERIQELNEEAEREAAAELLQRQRDHVTDMLKLGDDMLNSNPPPRSAATTVLL